MKAKDTCQKDLSEAIKRVESLVVPVPEVISYCFVCHHQERFSKLNPAFNSVRAECSAFRPGVDSMLNRLLDKIEIL
jgi:hypothetical protein